MHKCRHQRATERAPYCVMCGAVEGEPHQDNKQTVSLHKVRAFGEVKRLCMICRDGVYALRREPLVVDAFKVGDWTVGVFQGA